MAGEARKLAKKLQVPPAFTEGVGARRVYSRDADGNLIRGPITRGAQTDAVMDSADVILVKMDAALNDWKKAKAGGSQVNAAMKPLDEMAELVRRAAVESKDEGGAVVAHVASALMRLPVDDRMVVLRHAGRPELFEPLVNAGLAKPPLRGGVGNQPAGQTERLSKAADTIEAEKAQEFTVDQLPLAQRPSSFFVEPERYGRSGKKVDSSDTYKGHVPKEGNTPLDVQAKRGESPVHGTLTDPDTGEVVKKVPRGGSGGLTDQEAWPAFQRRLALQGEKDPAVIRRLYEAKQREDIEFFGMTEAADSTKRTAKNRLADDQIAQVKAIERQGLEPTLPQVSAPSRDRKDAVSVFVKENIGKLPRGVRFSALYSALRGSDSAAKTVKAARAWLDQQDPGLQRQLYDVARPRTGPDPDAVMATGASQRPGARWSGGEPLEIEDEVARRNRGESQKIIGMLYELTAPTTTEAAGAGKNARLRAVSPTDTTVDLDRLFPWWRARWPQLDAKGRYQYPARLPSAEWLAGIIQGRAKVEDKDFVTRVAPLLQRSIDAAPDVPSTEQAVQYSRKVFLLSPSMEQAMKAGVGAPDYPYPVYGERQVPRERVVKPARTLKEQQARAGTAAPQSQNDARSRVKALMQNADQPAEAAPQNTLDKMQKARERMKKFRDGPGTGDTSSIYSVPPSSPMRSLLA